MAVVQKCMFPEGSGKEVTVRDDPPAGSPVRGSPAFAKEFARFAADGRMEHSVFAAKRNL